MTLTCSAFLFSTGSCAHTGIVRVSKPIVNHVNHLSPGYNFGGWGKVSKPVPDRKPMYWFSGYSRATISEIKFYTDYKNLILRTPFQHHVLRSSWSGTGNNYIVRDNTVCYQLYNPIGLAKLSFISMTYASRVIPGASSRFSFSGSGNQNFDFAADETGLWVSYATDESNGKLVLAKIDEDSFRIVEELHMNLYKPGLSNTFMVCGVRVRVKEQQQLIQRGC